MVGRSKLLLWSVFAALNAGLPTAPNNCSGESIARPRVVVSVKNETHFYRGFENTFIQLTAEFVKLGASAHPCIAWEPAGGIEKRNGAQLILAFVQGLDDIWLVYRFGEHEPDIESLRVRIFGPDELWTDVEDLKDRTIRIFQKHLNNADKMKIIVGQFKLTDRVTVDEKYRRIVLPLSQREERLKTDSELRLIARRTLCDDARDKDCTEGSLAVRAGGPDPQLVNTSIMDFPCCSQDPWLADLKARLESPGAVVAVFLGRHAHCFDRSEEGCHHMWYIDLSPNP